MGSKGAVLGAIAQEHGLKRGDCSKMMSSLVDIATKEVKKTGIFTIPGLCRIKTRTKPATKAGVRNIFGKEVKVKAKPAKTVVKAFPVAASKLRFRTEGFTFACVPKGRAVGILWYGLEAGSVWLCFRHCTCQHKGLP